MSTATEEIKNDTPDSTSDPYSKYNPFEIARFLTAFDECSREIQGIVLEMATIVIDENATPDERMIAFDALIEALFPGRATDALEEYHERLKSEESLRASAELKAEEGHFADRLRTLMREKSVTQEQLAKAAGIGQPAVSNILNRRCRPQTRTVVRFAEALKVEPTALWPAFDSESQAH